jgi:hypothetical protein
MDNYKSAPMKVGSTNNYSKRANFWDGLQTTDWSRVARFFLVQRTKMAKNEHEIYQTAM